MFSTLHTPPSSAPFPSFNPYYYFTSIHLSFNLSLLSPFPSHFRISFFSCLYSDFPSFSLLSSCSLILYFTLYSLQHLILISDIFSHLPVFLASTTLLHSSAPLSLYFQVLVPYLLSSCISVCVQSLFRLSPCKSFGD